MYSKIISAVTKGINGIVLFVEADSSNGMPTFVMVGNLSQNVKEAEERIRTALHNNDIDIPPKRVTVNITPADIKKDGTHLDLPLAIAILKSLGYFSEVDIRNYAFLGEIGLDGKIIATRGILPMVTSLKEYGIKGVFVPKDNANEASVIGGIDVYAISHLKEIIKILDSNDNFFSAKTHPKYIYKESEENYNVDFQDVVGQNFLKRACEVAVSGNHNILFSGPAGSGKTMIAKRIPTIMPPLSLKENIEISKIYSIAGLLSKGATLLLKRPFRAPHHSITTTTLIGGGNYPIPGEISLAHNGVLFLDEIPLFSKFCIETLRQPLEDKEINITRLKGAYEYPANFMLVAAMNPCPCGYYPDRNRCNCKITDIRRYQRGISKPILERIDICAEASPLQYKDMTSNQKGECSKDIRERIKKVRQIQNERFKNYSKINYNAEMTNKEINKFCILEEEEKEYLEKIFTVKKLSARTYHKLLKVARTIADMGGSENIKKEHLIEAASYRGLEEKLFDELY